MQFLTPPPSAAFVLWHPRSLALPPETSTAPSADGSPIYTVSPDLSPEPASQLSNWVRGNATWLSHERLGQHSVKKLPSSSSGLLLPHQGESNSFTPSLAEVHAAGSPTTASPHSSLLLLSTTLHMQSGLP